MAPEEIEELEEAILVDTLFETRLLLIVGLIELVEELLGITEEEIAKTELELELV